MPGTNGFTKVWHVYQWISGRAVGTGNGAKAFCSWLVLPFCCWAENSPCSLLSSDCFITFCSQPSLIPAHVNWKLPLSCIYTFPYFSIKGGVDGTMQKQQAGEHARLHHPVLYRGHRTCSKALCALKLILLSFLSQLIQSQIYFSFPHL